VIVIAPEPIQDGAYSWSTGSSEHSIVVSEFDTYSLSITNYCGTASDEIEIGDLNCDCIVYFPNSFTPDGDEYNNTYRARHDCDFYRYEFRLFNRWGELIFESLDPSQGWDATYNGQFVQSGMYTYTLVYRTKYGIDKRLDGHVNVLR
jgi:gliding motility-associated-like protein